MSPIDKKATLKAISSISGYSRRLVEYFVVVSSVPTKIVNDSDDFRSPNVSYSSQFDDIPQNISIEKDMEHEFDFEPIITARYPLKDHHDSPLHQSVSTFCHPEGIIKLKSKPSLPKVSSYIFDTMSFSSRFYWIVYSRYSLLVVVHSKLIPGALLCHVRKTWNKYLWSLFNPL